MSTVREKIMDAFSSIPETLDNSQALLAIYWSRCDQKPIEKATRLYIAILAAIEHMIDWLDEAVFSKIP